jgi:hypothetical protein
MSDSEPVRPIVESWQHYRASRIAAHAGPSELQYRGGACLFGARAAFEALRERLENLDELDELSRLLETIASELGIDDIGRAALSDE